MNTYTQKPRLLLGIVAAVALLAASGAYAVAATGPAPAPKNPAGDAAAGPPPAAAFAIVAPTEPQPPSTPFAFTSNLTTFDTSSPLPWGGYGVEIAYDASVIEIRSAAPDLCAPTNVWANPALAPHIVTGCIGQANTSTGVLDTFTATCLRPGTSRLELVPGASTSLFSPQAVPFPLTLTGAAVTCAAGGSPLSPAPPSAHVAPTPTSITLAVIPGAATLSMTAPANPQPIGAPFLITSTLSSLTLTQTEPAWAGYDFEMAYDASIIEVLSVRRGQCAPAGVWASPAQAPHLITGCFAQQQTSTGVMETITARCLRSGTSALHILPQGENGAQLIGTELFDEYARSAFELTLVDSSVTCGESGQSAPSTLTPTP